MCVENKICFYNFKTYFDFTLFVGLYLYFSFKEQNTFNRFVGNCLYTLDNNVRVINDHTAI